MAILTNWDPLRLPRGSIRGIVTLLLLAVLWAQMLLEREISLALASLILFILGHYFGALGSQPSPSEGKHPLFLPRGSVRIIIVVGFILVSFFLWRDGKLEFTMANRNFSVLLIVGALVLGVLAQKMADLLSRGQATKPRRFFENLKAVLVLIGTVLLVLVSFFEAEKPVSQNVALVAVPLISFYFGSR